MVRYSFKSKRFKKNDRSLDILGCDIIFFVSCTPIPSVPVICANIDNINNNAREDKLDNNSTCKETRVGQFDVLNIYPNPALS